MHFAKVDGRRYIPLNQSGRQDLAPSFTAENIASEQLSISLSDEWAACDAIAVIFASIGGSYSVDYDADYVTVPHEVLETGDNPVYVSVCGYVGDTVRLVTAQMDTPYAVLRNGELLGDVPTQTTPDALEQAYARATAAATTAESAAQDATSAAAQARTAAGYAISARNDAIEAADNADSAAQRALAATDAADTAASTANTAAANAASAATDADTAAQSANTAAASATQAAASATDAAARADASSSEADVAASSADSAASAATAKIGEMQSAITQAETAATNAASSAAAAESYMQQAAHVSTLTQDEYDALATKDAGTIYLIVG